MGGTMKQFPFPDTRLWRAGYGALLTALLFLVRDSMYSQIFGFNLCQFASLGLLGLAGITFLVYNRRNLKDVLRDRRVLFFLTNGLLLVGLMVIKGDWQLMYLSLLIYIAAGIFFSFFENLEHTAKVYVILIAVLAAWSILAAYVLRLLPQNGILELPVLINGAGKKFWPFGLSFVPVTYVKHRNFGVFREPGVYQYFILLALYLNNYYVNWKSSRSLWAVNILLAVTMLTTFATGGVIEMGLLAVVIFFDKGYHKDRRWRILACCLVALAALAAAYSFATRSLLYRPLKEMFTKLFTRHESTMDRLGSILVNLRLFLSSPILGASIYDVLHGIDNNTSSSTILFAMLGFVGGAYHVAGWFCLVWQEKKRWLAQLCILGILAMSFNTCNVMWDLYFWLFPTMAICEKWLPAREKM